MSSGDDSATLKAVLLVLILFFGLCGVLSPRLFNPFGQNITYANLASSGVLLSAGIVHLLAEAVEEVNEAFPRNSEGENYPWGYVICGITFYLVFCTERVVIHSFIHTHMDGTPQVQLQEVKMLKNSQPTPNNLDDKPHENDAERDADTNESPSPLPIPSEKTHNHGHEHEHGTDFLVLFNSRHYRSAAVLLFGLGLHSILAGLALGASNSKETALSLGIAILAHKYLASFVLGCSLTQSTLKTHCIVAVLFALLTPLGIVVGWTLQRVYSFESATSAVFVCIASGTFLYVSICEILIPEYNKGEHGHQCDEPDDKGKGDAGEHKHFSGLKHEILKVLSLLTGFALMSLLANWT